MLKDCRGVADLQMLNQSNAVPAYLNSFASAIFRRSIGSRRRSLPLSSRRSKASRIAT